jgi:glycosyltransferase involved in cell wall biosynthesis
MPAAFAAADTVLVSAIEPPILGRVVAEAQAMGRPVVTSNVGVLPEHLVTPPEMPEEVRTGWLAEPGDAADFARALAA